MTQIVLLPGWSTPAAIFKPLEHALESDYQVSIAPLPQLGADSIKHPRDYTLENILPLLLAQIPPKSIIFGWSLGGMLALELAHHYSNHLSKIITCSTNLKFVQDANWSCAMLAQDFSAFTQLLSTDQEKCIDRFIGLMCRGSGQFKQHKRELKGLYAQNSLCADTLAASLQLLSSLDLRSVWPPKVAGLHMYGQQDAVVPVKLTNHLSAADKQQISILENSCHIPFVDQLEQVVRSIKNFAAG
jgi:pimeloyl-[acyl-carrier protein] methyl ester esterase